MVPSHRESVTLWQIDARIRPGDGQVLKNVYHWSEKSMEWQKSNPTDWGTHSSNAHLPGIQKGCDGKFIRHF